MKQNTNCQGLSKIKIFYCSFTTHNALVILTNNVHTFCSPAPAFILYSIFGVCYSMDRQNAIFILGG